MLLHLGSCLHIIVRIEIQCVDGAVNVAIGERRLGFFYADRRVADTEIGEPHIGETLAIGARAGGQSDNRIVAVPACELGKANARILVSHRDTNGRYYFVGSQRSLKQALEES